MLRKRRRELHVLINMKRRNRNYIVVPGARRSTIHFRHKMYKKIISSSLMSFEKEKNHTALLINKQIKIFRER